MDDEFIGADRAVVAVVGSDGVVGEVGVREEAEVVNVAVDGLAIAIDEGWVYDGEHCLFN